MQNPSTIYATLFVDALAQAGLRAVCIAPGSRSTPLTLAFARCDDITKYTHLDERSAGFFALGLARASAQPVALVCTSGTAAANFFPAIIEAHMSQVPLIVLTADRPHALRHSGANQTIDQIKLYGDHVLWSVDAALPEANPPPVALRNLRTLAARAYATANGARQGVVHINMPFRKPLEPTPGDDLVTDIAAIYDQFGLGRHKPQTKIHRAQGGEPCPATMDVARDLARVIATCERGIIVAGVDSRVDDTCSATLLEFADQVGYPVLADPVSGLRFNNNPGTIIGGYDAFLADATLRRTLYPDVILRIGTLPTSAYLNALLDEAQAATYVYINPSGVWADDAHRVTDVVQADVRHIIKSIQHYLATDSLPQRGTWRDGWHNLERRTWATIQANVKDGAYFDGAVIQDVVALSPTGSVLFVGNSLPVRLLDQFGTPHGQRILAYANRGASGIDGNMSTALGIGAAYPDAPLIAIIGDITFYHDMNGLLAIHRFGIPMTIVLLNNDGGGIFHRLPIKDHEPYFTPYFVTPHGLQFEHAAHLYGLDYVRAGDRATFGKAFMDSINRRASTLIEVPTAAQHDLQRRQAILDAVRTQMSDFVFE